MQLKVRSRVLIHSFVCKSLGLHGYFNGFTRPFKGCFIGVLLCLKVDSGGFIDFSKGYNVNSGVFPVFY